MDEVVVDHKVEVLGYKVGVVDMRNWVKVVNTQKDNWEEAVDTKRDSWVKVNL